MNEWKVVTVLYVILYYGGLSLAADIDDAAHCSPGWMYYGEACYLFSREKDTWSEASSHCRAFHAELTDIGYEGENGFIRSEISHLHIHDPQKDTVCYYLSGTDLAVEGQWVWASTGQSFSYTDWGPGEPNQNGDGENCVSSHGYRDFHWADISCHIHCHFVCKLGLGDETMVIG